MSDRITIRKATEGDVDTTCRLWVNMVKELAPANKPNRYVWKSLTRELICYRPEYRMFVAEANQTVIGFVDGTIELDAATDRVRVSGRHFYIVPEQRKSPAAGMLYRKMIREGKSLGADDIFFNTANGERPMWERHGYKVGSNAMMRRIT